jgi:hypothetical protein
MPHGLFEFGNDGIFCLLHHYPLGGLPDIARIECTTMTNAAYARVKLGPRRNTGWMYRSSENLMTEDKPEKNKITRMKRRNVISLTFRTSRYGLRNLPIFKALQTWPPMATKRATASPLMRASILLWPPVLLNSASRTGAGNDLRAEGEF